MNTFLKKTCVGLIVSFIGNKMSVIAAGMIPSADIKVEKKDAE